MWCERSKKELSQSARNTSSFFTLASLARLFLAERGAEPGFWAFLGHAAPPRQIAVRMPEDAGNEGFWYIFHLPKRGLRGVQAGIGPLPSKNIACVYRQYFRKLLVPQE